MRLRRTTTFMINEELLHHIWKYRLFSNSDLRTTDGRKVQILKPGEHNSNAGPDFFNARVIVGDTTWAGNVEIHIKTSDYSKHHHEIDTNYQNLLLHVVYEDDVLVHDPARQIATVELKNFVSDQILKQYAQLSNSPAPLPCGKQLRNVDSLTLHAWLDKLMIERLEHKTNQVLDSLIKNHNNWEETFWHFFARSFGAPINSVPFELMAKSLNNLILAKHKHSIYQLEALLLGQAGFLEKIHEEEYPLSLKKEYEFLRQKFSLFPIDHSLFKFLRLRPAAFPVFRLAQLAAIIHKNNNLFSKLLESKNVNDVYELLTCDVSSYWKKHYSFNSESNVQNWHLGKNTMDVIIINTIVPFMFAWGKQHCNERMLEKALALPEQIKAENNKTIRLYEEAGLQPKSAFQTQALLQLKKYYCDEKACLNCRIGNFLLRCS